MEHELELTAWTDCGDHIQRKASSSHLDDRCLVSGRPRGSHVVVRVDSRFIGKVEGSALGLCLSADGGKARTKGEFELQRRILPNRPSQPSHFVRAYFRRPARNQLGQQCVLVPNGKIRKAAKITSLIDGPLI